MDLGSGPHFGGRSEDYIYPYPTRRRGIGFLASPLPSSLSSIIFFGWRGGDRFRFDPRLNLLPKPFGFDLVERIVLGDEKARFHHKQGFDAHIWNPLNSNAIGMGEKDVNRISNVTDFLSAVPYDKWVLVNPDDWRPSARYKHAAEVVQDKLYVIGGSRNGRYLSDVQVFDFRTLKWSTVSANMDPKRSKSDTVISDQVFPASAGHSVVKWENKLVVVAGHCKESSDTVKVWLIDLETHSWSAPATNGEAPIARGGQSISLVGSLLFMFGGEDNRRRLLNDLYILDLNTMTWEAVRTKKAAPAPRYDHTAVVYADQYLLIFGGSSYSPCFNDLHLLDLQTMEWSQPETQGTYVTPRGGHASTLIEENWYIVGGGDNKSGATETIVLNTSKFVWSVAASVTVRDPLASEGLTLSAMTVDGENFIIAFGGYNGKYNNEIYIMKPKPRDTLRPRLLQSPAAAAAAASVTAAYAVISANDEKSIDINTVDDSDIKGVQPNGAQEFAIKVDELTTEKNNLESRLTEVREENSRLKTNLDAVNNSYSELGKELQSVQGQLEAESARCLKLEVAQIAFAQKRLESFSSLEHELETLRRQKSQIERTVAPAQKQRSGGMWQWVSGSAENPE
ncbi:Acyl-CoA-binding domain-containing protein 4 [Ananas comosus]|uniref:Acyl-CoA-binding domain-containing protein 4 n=1 Tax=Ananas comosus TaxID=4615 RepID=A0A199VW03_ANACO|nr:Acyl-CoA-binding domain-containing protein 4 [Ananas comosus]